MAVNARRGVPRTTHTWLRALYNYLDTEIAYVQPAGATGTQGLALLIGAGAPQTDIGNATGLIGMYGTTGILRPTGLGAVAGITAASGYDARSNGGIGTNFYSLQDLVLIMKQRGDITT